MGFSIYYFKFVIFNIPTNLLYKNMFNKFKIEDLKELNFNYFF